jgi:hypothetical protein
MSKTMKRILLLALLIALLGSKASAQAFRYESQVSQEADLLGIPVPVLTIPSGPIVSVCNFPANAVPCTNKATTYTTISQVFTCSTSTQLVLAGTSTCVSNTDSQGNWGVWVAPGVTYSYTVSVNGQNLGPFSFTAGGAGGGGSGSANLMVAFTNVTSASLSAASLNTQNLITDCWDASTPTANGIGFNRNINPLTLVVTFGFTVPQSGYCVVNGSGGGGGGSAGAVLLSPVIAQSIAQPAGTSLDVTGPGLFTNSQTSSLRAIVNACSPVGIYNFAYGNTHFTTDAFSSCLAVPSGSTSYQSDTIGCYGTNASTTTLHVCGFFMTLLTASGAHGWGINPLCQENPGINPVTSACISAELDVNNNTGTDVTDGQASPLNGADIVSGGPNIANVALFITSAAAGWQRGIEVGGFHSRGINFDGFAGSVALNVNPADDSTQFELQGLNHAGTNQAWFIGNNGASSFTGTVEATGPPPNGSPNSSRGFYSSTNRLPRWLAGANGTVESGTNAGSDYNILRYDDGGNLIDAPFAIKRSTGVLGLLSIPTVAGSNVALSIGNGSLTSLGTIITTGVCQSQGSVTVTGATQATDVATPFLNIALPATFQTGIRMDAQVTSANTVTIYLCNPTTGSITPSATTINVKVIR